MRYRKEDMVLILTEWDRNGMWSRVRFKEFLMIQINHVGLCDYKNVEVCYGVEYRLIREKEGG